MSHDAPKKALPAQPGSPSIAPATIERTVSVDPSADKQVGGHTDYHGIDTTQVQPGADPVYEAKISIMNEALIDVGMGPFRSPYYSIARQD
ncbi:hypothetical protein ACJ41O_005707 [Fusarium nematophilum]